MGRERERERDHLSSSLSVLPLPLPVAGCVGLGFSLEEARAPKVIFLLSLLATPPTALPPSTEHRGGKEASSPVLLLPPPHTLQEAHFSLSPSPSAASFSFTPLPLLLSLQFFSGIARGRKEALLAPSPSLLWYFLFSPTQASKQTVTFSEGEKRKLLAEKGLFPSLKKGILFNEEDTLRKKREEEQQFSFLPYRGDGGTVTSCVQLTSTREQSDQ